MYASATIHVRLQSDGTPEPTGLEGKFICPMHPEVVKDEPGQCPRCEMNLEQVPKVFPTQKIVAAQTPNSEAPAEESMPKQPEAGKEPAEEEVAEDSAPQVLAIRKSAVLDTGRGND